MATVMPSKSNGSNMEATIEPPVPTGNWIDAFVSAFVMFVGTEFCDQTFFLTATLAMNHRKLPVFIGSTIGLSLMHVVAVIVGSLAGALPRQIARAVSGIIFSYFSIKNIRKALVWRPSSPRPGGKDYRISDRIKETAKMFHRTIPIISTVLIEACVLNVLSEAGDRTQIATAAYVASNNADIVRLLAVIFGGIAGQILCNFIAVVVGRAAGQWLSRRTLAIVGAAVFMIAALMSFLKLYFDIDD